MFAMSIFKLPKGLCDEIQSAIFKFWWGSKMDGTKIHWVHGDRLCAKKDIGGKGFRDLETFNTTLLSKQVWRLLYDPLSFLTRLLKAKYYPKGNILTADIGHRSSSTRRGLWEVKSVIEKGSSWVIGDNCSVDIWDCNGSSLIS